MAKKSIHKLMRMKQLREAAGVSKWTIQFYVKEGLIPKPVKTSPNMAYYDQSHLNAIRLVRELQTKRFLPLSVIKQLVTRGKGGLSVHEIRTLVQMDGKLFRNLEENPDVQPITAQELSKRTGVSTEDIRVFERIGILNPIQMGKKKVFEEDDILLVECYGKLQDLGLTKELGLDPTLFTIHRDSLERIVMEEAKKLTTQVAGKVPMKQLIKIVEEGTTITNTMIGVIHKKLIVETVKKYAAEFQDTVMMRNPNG